VPSSPATWGTIMSIPARHLLDYDSVAVAVLISGISILALLVLVI
jgi:hypothetical protein